jgi:hypothetical protein
MLIEPPFGSTRQPSGNEGGRPAALISVLPPAQETEKTMLSDLRSLLIPLFVAAFVGCEPPHSRPPKTPHDGTLVPIPGNKGTVEILKRDAEGRADQVQLVVYFYGPDDRPMTTLPTAATFTPSARGAKTILLKDTGNSDACMASEPFSNTVETEGKLVFPMDGSPTTIPVRDR